MWSPTCALQDRVTRRGSETVTTTKKKKIKEEDKRERERKGYFYDKLRKTKFTRETSV